MTAGVEAAGAPDLLARRREVLASPPVPAGEGRVLGRSRDGRAVRGFRFGRAPRRLSLIAGCHADEPVGPILLRRLAACLAALPADDPLVRDLEWWIVPHANPDGEALNGRWAGHRDAGGAAYDVARYLAFAVREPPGDDVEFGFPADEADDGARPENRAIHAWWREAEGPFALHCSLHGMAVGAGPWFLLEPAWVGRSAGLRRRLAAAVGSLGHVLHDVERRGEKGFVRIGRGFCTRPDSRAMKAHFVALGDPETADRFRPSSMEAVRALGGDPLTLVSEVPLFVTPGVGEDPGPPDPVAERWGERFAGWRIDLRGEDDRTTPAPALDGEAAERVRREAAAAGLRPMPVEAQLRVQWTMIAAGLEHVLSWP